MVGGEGKRRERGEERGRKMGGKEKHIKSKLKKDGKGSKQVGKRGTDTRTFKKGEMK